ncbi:MAG: isoprenyl transferase [Alphaproteobacteria bacterium]|nr:isoprenyl transferase [Alphaproteobacteria bacterium]
MILKGKQSEIITDIPRHIAVIMDGNGRWANNRGLPRTMGHKQGAESARKIVKHAAELGVEYLTLFGFSSENWKRPQSEINDLMQLLRQYLRKETAELHKNKVKLMVIGDKTAFDEDIIRLIDNAERLTKDNTGITVIMALNYGGRYDIAQAAQAMMKEALADGNIPEIEEIEESMPTFLSAKDIPDPDLLIRTSGEKRISNFLLWQCAYSEMVFTPTLWPDFDKDDLVHAINEYAERDRRFGAIKKSGA